jgi:hypothetical protein
MSLRKVEVLGTGFVALLALMAYPAGAPAASNSKLWLKDPISGKRLVNGEPVAVEANFEECNIRQSATLLANGQRVDKLSIQGSPSIDTR